jgi:hypothetical protein
MAWLAVAIREKIGIEVKSTIVIEELIMAGMLTVGYAFVSPWKLNT